jgi:4-oxalocrotonate tautomerase
MAFITVTLIEGRSYAQKADLLHQLTVAMQRSLGAAPENVRIALDEIPAAHFAVAGVAKTGPSGTITPRKP